MSTLVWSWIDRETVVLSNAQLPYIQDSTASTGIKPVSVDV
jgi:hypothetical protein